MREILFRGKLRISGNWAFSQCPTAIMSCGVLTYDFIPETVGQFTGLTDKNGKKIFEGDIVAYYWYDAEPMNFRIDFVSGEFLAVPLEKREDVWAIRISAQGENFEVIGNIHDNPELIGGKGNA